jgi:hypothetical protein
MTPSRILRVTALLACAGLAACADRLPSAPLAVVGDPSLIVAPTNAFATMEGGRDHACGLTSAGLGWCWGRNAYGQLGDSSAAATPVPVAVLHPSGVTFDSITGGGAHTCALTGAGQAYCWGHNADGRLGDSTTVLPLMPVAVLPLGGIVFTRINAGDMHTATRTGRSATAPGRTSASAPRPCISRPASPLPPWWAAKRTAARWTAPARPTAGATTATARWATAARWVD